jgi:DDE_Tnp_1-associated/Transposase DDE domain
MSSADERPGSLAEALAMIPDPRREHLRVHNLVPLLQMAVAAMLSGARSLYAIAQWGRERLADGPDLLLALGLRPGRSPSVATIHRVFKRVDVVAFERVLGEWLARTGVAPDEPLAVDGKTLRGIHGEEIPGVHLVSVYAVGAGAVLAQIAAEGKGQELAAAKKALAEAPLEGRIVMADALLTQREVCEEIVRSGGDYLLPVKENQPALLSDLEEAFSPSEPYRRCNGKRTGDGGLAGEAVGSAGDGVDDRPARIGKGGSRSARASSAVGAG